MSERVTASAPGKLMLFGEYAVLEGHRALALCVDRRIRCEVRRGGDRLLLCSPGVFEPPVDLPASALGQPDCPDPRLALLWPILRAHLDGGATLRFEAEFPPSWGLGSSSASTLAAAGALAGVSPARFIEARDAQRALQGAASGYDVATQLLGGCVAYRDADPPEMERVEPTAEPDWIVAWTGAKAKTGGMIRQVRRRFPAGSPIYGEIGALAERGIDLLRSGDLAGLGAALDAGQALLASLGAVPEELARRVAAVQASPGVLGARMSGAGGGDCVLVLAADRPVALEAVRKAGLEPLDLAIEPRGLLIEPWSPR